MGGILDMGKIEMTDEYVRVGTTLYKIVFQPLINGTFYGLISKLCSHVLPE